MRGPFFFSIGFASFPYMNITTYVVEYVMAYCIFMQFYVFFFFFLNLVQIAQIAYDTVEISIERAGLFLYG